MEENKQGRITAQNAVSNAENLQENEKVSNFALQGFMDPRTDFGFKKIFGSKKVMLPFLNDVLDMGSPIEDIEFLTTEMTPEHKEERNVFYDLRCRTADGMEFLVEMQRADQTYFPVSSPSNFRASRARLLKSVQTTLNVGPIIFTT